MITSPRILDRDLGTLAGDHAELTELETKLAEFTQTIAAAEIDEADEHTATRRYIALLAGAGLLRYVVPKALGGVADEVRSTPVCIIRQWLARQSGALDTAFIMQGLGSYPVVLGGSAALKEKILPRVATGAMICAFALTEPEAGSDVGNIQTIASPVDDAGDVRLDGTKAWISNAGIADSYVVFAREAEPGPEGKARFGAFWVPGDAEGLSIEPMRVIAPHPIGIVKLNGVRVPARHRLGLPGKGLRLAFSTLEVFRVTVGAAALGLADRALTETVAHLKTRIQFGKPLCEQQGLGFLVAEVATEHVAAQLLVYRAAAARDANRSTPDQPAMAKLFATEAAQRVVDRAVQCLGGRGVTVGSVTERLYREVRALRIYEGTSEIQKLVIARNLFGP